MWNLPGLGIELVSPALVFPGGSVCRVFLYLGRPGFNPWVGKIPWGEEWLPTPVFLPGEIHGAWQATVHGVAESDMTQ